MVWEPGRVNAEDAGWIGRSLGIRRALLEKFKRLVRATLPVRDLPKAEETTVDAFRRFCCFRPGVGLVIPDTTF